MMGGVDVLRILSACAVVLLHVNAEFYFADSNYDLQKMVECILNFVARFSVPSFVMISGAYAIRDKNKDFLPYYKKILFKIGIPYFGILLFVYPCIFYKYIIQENDWGMFARSFFAGESFNLWFMPMIFILYLLTPVLVRLKDCLGSMQFKIITCVLLAWAIVSQSTTEYMFPWSIGNVMSYLSYFLLGNVIADMKEEMSVKYLSAIKMLFVLSALLGTGAILLRLRGFDFYELKAYAAFFSPAVVIWSIFVFILFKGNAKIRTTKKLKAISDLTFYIYLVHTFVLYFLKAVLRNIFTNNSYELINLLILYILVLFISMCVAIVYKRIIRLFCKRIILRKDKGA